MKWAHTLVKRSEALPDWMRDKCISYKDWKKRFKKAVCRVETDDFISRSILLDCKRVDRAFVKAYKEAFEPSPFSCIVGRADVASRDQILLFAELNATTLRKICKRIDKRLQSKVVFRSWLNGIRSKCVYEFLGGWRKSSLSIEVPAECPICLEDCDRIAIARCGHYICERCLSRIYEFSGRNGTMNNLIQTCEERRRSHCPQCRVPNPFYNMCIWPPSSKNHIKIFGLLKV